MGLISADVELEWRIDQFLIVLPQVSVENTEVDEDSHKKNRFENPFNS